MVKVEAPIRRRTAHDEPVSNETALLTAEAPTYEEARDQIRAQVPDGWLVLAWFADDENRRRMAGLGEAG